MYRRIVIILSLLTLAASDQSAQQGFVGDAIAGSPPMIKNCSADGIVVNALTGEPIPRARVDMRGANVTSDANGRFRAENIFCGQFAAFATRPGFLTSMAGPTTGPTKVVRFILSPGTAAHDYRVTLTPQSVITGIVTDDQGDPVMGAQLSVFASRVMQGRRTFQQMAASTSNDLGEFRVPALEAGKYVVCARAGNLNLPDADRPLVSGEKCYPGPIDGGAGSAFDLSAGRDTRVVLSLPTVPVVRIRGTVTGLVKSRGVSVSLARSGTSGSNTTRNSNVAPDGKFEVRGVTAGAYSLKVDYWEDNNRFVGRVPIDVGSNDIDGVTVHLSQGFAISGTVRLESKDIASSSRPLFTVTLRSSDPMAGGGRLVWGPDRSTFTLADITPATYRLESFGNGNFFIRSAMFNGRDISREDVPITQAGGTIDLVMSDVGGSLEGQVVNREGAPQPGWVMVEEEGRTPRPIAVDDSGNFRVPAVPPGTYKLYAWNDFTQVEYANPEWMTRNGLGEKVTVEAGQTARVKLIRKDIPSQ